MDYNVPTIQKLVHYIHTLERDFPLCLALAGLRNAPGERSQPLRPKLFSISCKFFGNFSKIICWRPLTWRVGPLTRGILWILNGWVRGRVSSLRTRFWTLPNLNSEVSIPKILLFSYWFFMQIGWTAFTAWISLGIGLHGHFQIKVRKCPEPRPRAANSSSNWAVQITRNPAVCSFSWNFAKC